MRIPDHILRIYRRRFTICIAMVCMHHNAILLAQEQTVPQPPVPAVVRLTVLSGEPRIKHSGNSSPHVKFAAKGKLIEGIGPVQFKFELENLSASPLANVRLVITVLDKTTAVDKQGQFRQGKLSIQFLNGGSLDARKKAQYSQEILISFDDKSKYHPVEAYSVDVFADRQLLLTQTFPPSAQKMMDDKKLGSDEYSEWTNKMIGGAGAKHNQHGAESVKEGPPIPKKSLKQNDPMKTETNPSKD